MIDATDEDRGSSTYTADFGEDFPDSSFIETHERLPVFAEEVRKVAELAQFSKDI